METKQREIKFRHWFPSTKVMTAGNHPYIFILTSDGKEDFWKDAVWMQFTGKLGFNSRELYEGDIVFYEEAKEDGSGDERYYLVIVWISEWSMFASLHMDEYLKYVDEGVEALDETMFWTYTLEKSDYFHYAGNILETPDLIK